MEIIKFNNFINESDSKKRVQIKTFDLVIDNSGRISYSRNGLPIKGHLDTTRDIIIGSDNKTYIAAIDRGGNLYYSNDKNGDTNLSITLDDDKFILLNNRRVPRTGNEYWNKNNNYSDLLPMTPTGWVNVKIDMEVIKKIRRYSKPASEAHGIQGLKERLESLTRTRSAKTTTDVQKELSSIMMLHYLNELKGHFDPSSAGFLFESYIAGLITDSIVGEDNSSIDIKDSYGKKYQIKLIEANSGTLEITKYKDKIGDQTIYSYLDYYIIGLKYADKIRIVIISSNPRDRNYIDKYKTKTYIIKDEERRKKREEKNSESFSIPILRNLTASSYNMCYELTLLNIDRKISSIAKGLKGSLDKLYKNLSEFQFNVETIITGVNERGDIIEPVDFVRIQNDSKRNLISMDTELNSLINIIDIDNKI